MFYVHTVLTLPNVIFCMRLINHKNAFDDRVTI